ncbi:MAG TPA: pyridoxamine 5'-phosphate oxidase family protein [Actinophytocola sp.]|uniref:pyridoxamine 5'-phosphate oxidase family protein n=1 Tax=Actinophytocola sp. TaxID=1872138 RepID=UPI002DDD996F|nr:pyridoxamine 5'-phosphate oxidase family protein [Actinophytocola sp.]HEV2781029.1 pyridoxamine 5'-phosphate oxidase family protein [Actinophytocola sp.]
MDPIAELLDLPKIYGTPKKKLAWAVVRTELERAKHYWLTTVRSDGRPHAVPLDGVWLDDVWYYGGSEESVHRRTALAHPPVVMHLPDPIKAVIVEGSVRRTRPGVDLAQRLADTSNEKYGYGNTAGSYAETLALHPSRVIAWMSYLTDATRFRFPAG